MINHSGLRPYPKYKVSGVEWLGEIPEHWNTSKIKRISIKIGSGKTPKGGAESYVSSGIIFLRSQNIHFDGLHLEDAVFIDEITDNEMASTRVIPGDVLLNITGASLGRCAFAPENIPSANVNQHVCIIRPIKEKIQSKFLNYYLSSNPAQAQIFLFEDGVSREGLTFMQVGCLEITFLPFYEQRAIAAFLDRETAKIDALISKKERLIELLQEKRVALISHAVTKGLDPSVPMKDSGVEWLGEIPDHWQIKSFQYIVSYISYGFTNPMPVVDDGPYMLTANDIGDGKIFYEAARKTSESAFINLLTNKSRPYKNDILITKDGTLGRIAVFDDERACINQSIALIRIKEEIASIDFVQNMLRSAPYQDRMRLDAGGTTIKHIYISRITKMLIALPSCNEQLEICAFINIKRSNIDKMIEKVVQSIEILKEYRTALISAAVIGKIDVRDEVGGIE